MARTLDEYMKLPYSVHLMRSDGEDGSYVIATNPELQGCISHGDTSNEALANLKEARRDYISTLLEIGRDVPLPENYTDEKRRINVVTLPNPTVKNQYEIPGVSVAA